MSGFLSGMNIFGRSNAPQIPPSHVAPTQSGQQQQLPYQPGQQQLQQPANNNNPQQTAQTNQGQQEPNNNPNNNADPNKGSQLDNFTDLFKVKTDDKGQPVQQTDPFSTPIMSVDPQKLREAAGKMNFTAGIDQELVQKAMSGQDPAAFMQVLNIVGQNGFSTALAAAGNITNTALDTYHQRIDKALPDRIRNVQISQGKPKNPALSHPAAAPMVHALKAQFASANPQLSPDQVNEMAENYFTSFAADFSKAADSANPQKKTVPAETDWTQLLG